MANDWYVAGFATLIAEMVTLPICTLKTNYQVLNPFSFYQPYARPPYSLRKIIKFIYHHKGWIGFYNASHSGHYLTNSFYK